jgi:hypothetical protein
MTVPVKPGTPKAHVLDIYAGLPEYEEKHARVLRGKAKDTEDARKRRLRLVSDEDSAPDKVRAPAVRRERGDVAEEERTIEDARGRVVGRTSGDAVQCALGKAHARKLLTNRQFTAARMLQDCWITSQGRERVTIDPTATARGGGGDSAAAIFEMRAEASSAKREFERAIKHIGARLAPVVLTCVVMDRPAAEWARSIGWAERDGLPVLRIALEALGDFFSLA